MSVVRVSLQEYMFRLTGRIFASIGWQHRARGDALAESAENPHDNAGDSLRFLMGLTRIGMEMVTLTMLSEYPSALLSTVNHPVEFRLVVRFGQDRHRQHKLAPDV